MALYGSVEHGIDIAEISAQLNVTAVDVFVYDTSKDSDGGAWRNRTQHTSWYNEELNTATRGSRRKFPAVAVIVAEDDKVTIYDGDDPALPMWMVFNTGVTGSTYAFLISGNITNVTMLNGLMCAGRGSFIGIDFLGDRAVYIALGSAGDYDGNPISERNGRGSLNEVNWLSNDYLVGAPINDVAMAVLPNAPIDPATGLPIPTIACLVGETEIAMADGSTKRLDEIQLGDVVKTLEGNNKVLNWWDQGIKDVIELEFDDGQTIICTPDHKIRTTEGWVEAADLTNEHEVIGL